MSEQSPKNEADASREIRIAISELVNQLNNNYSKASEVREMVAFLLHDIFSLYQRELTSKETAEFITVIYELFLHSCKSNPAAACYIICGFIQFTHSNTGYQYKPMIDHFVLAAFDWLVENTGWSIIKPCIISLADSFTDSNIPFTNEPFFNHIVYRIVKQLYADSNEAPPYYNSDLCANLPREKSFVWGWFARYIAIAYFPTGRKTISSKQMRMRLMWYRKLIGKLQEKKAVKFVLASAFDTDPETPSEWVELVAVLNIEKYKWAKTLVFTALSVDEGPAAQASEAQAPETQAKQGEEVEIVEIEEQAQEQAEQAQEEAQAEQAQAEQAQEQAEKAQEQAPAEQAQAQPEENKEEEEKINERIIGEANLGTGGSWLKWIGWA
jgi:hypothetical protein